MSRFSPESRGVVAQPPSAASSSILRTLPVVVGLLAGAPAPGQDDDRAREMLRAVRADEARRVAVFERAARSVVCIFADKSASGGGSGVIVTEDGYGLTNFHVVLNLLPSRKGWGGLSDGRLYPLTVLGIDPGGDVAVFKLAGRDRFHAAPLGDSDAVRVGDPAAAMGNPFVLAEDYTPTITFGIISGVHRYQAGQQNKLEYADCIQSSTSINPGNSGGPLFDAAGRVIGINGRASFEERGRVNVGVGYAISINQIKRFWPALRAGQMRLHGTLGATVTTAGDDLIFDALQQASPASRAGIRLGDVLRAVNGRPIRSPNEFNNAIASLPENWPVSLTVERGGERVMTRTRLERLNIRKLPKYVLDYKHNHAELRRVLDRYRRRDQQAAPAATLSRITWSGTLRVGNDEGVKIRVVQRADGSVRVSDLAQQQEFTVAGEESATDSEQAAPGVDEPWRSAAFWKEWHALSYPLLVPPRISLGWELLGGDEVNGRIAEVVERRFADGRRYRWKFDIETGRLVQCTAGGEEHAEQTVWTPADRRPFGELNWPRVWRRGDAAEANAGITLEIDSISIESSESDVSNAVNSADSVDSADGVDTAEGVAHGFSRGGLESTTDSRPPPLNRWATQTVPAEKGMASKTRVFVQPDDAHSPNAATGESSQAFSTAIDSAAARVVKLYGSGIGREHGYGSGVLVSADGRIITVLSLLLEARQVRVVLADGTRYVARIIRRDEQRRLALLKIKADGLPHFDLSAAAKPAVGDWVVSAANAFKIAQGAEAVSVSVGIVSGFSTLAGRRRTQDFPYTGPVILVDVIVATPGSAGGALVDLDGRLVGVIGTPVISEMTNTWLNYALPVEQVVPLLHADGTPDPAEKTDLAATDTPQPKPLKLGIRLFRLGGRSKPAYVERVRRGSPAAKAGVKKNDLILSINGRLIATCTDFDAEIEKLTAGQPVELVVKRKDQLVTLRIAEDHGG